MPPLPSANTLLQAVQLRRRIEGRGGVEGRKRSSGRERSKRVGGGRRIKEQDVEEGADE